MTAALRDSNPPRHKITQDTTMLYAILKNAYRWFFLLMREAQRLRELFDNKPSYLRKQYREEAEGLTAFIRALQEQIDPEEKDRFASIRLNLLALRKEAQQT